MTKRNTHHGWPVTHFPISVPNQARQTLLLESHAVATHTVLGAVPGVRQVHGVGGVDGGALGRHLGGARYLGHLQEEEEGGNMQRKV